MSLLFEPFIKFVDTDFDDYPFGFKRQECHKNGCQCSPRYNTCKPRARKQHPHVYRPRKTFREPEPDYMTELFNAMMIPVAEEPEKTRAAHAQSKKSANKEFGEPDVSETASLNSEPETPLASETEAEEPSSDKTFRPSIDLTETENGFTLYVSIPGASKEDVSVDFNKNDNILTVSGEVKTETHPNTFFNEIQSGKFERKIALSAEIVESDVSAEYVNGLLKVNIPKKQPEPKHELKRIPVIWSE